MKIFLRGSEDRVKVMQEKIGNGHELTYGNDAAVQHDSSYKSFDLVIDLNLDETGHRLSEYKLQSTALLIGSSVKKSLLQICDEEGIRPQFLLAGINAIPAFLDRELFEISCLNQESKQSFEAIAKKMNWKYKIVEDSIGMVSPRVICMIINEAFYTLQEGVASREDIETGMKLGTAFPHGPFEWCEKIGVENVCETLFALRDSTNDQRYQISELLKSQYQHIESPRG